MASIISFFIILSASFIIVRVASVMLRLTGLSQDVARFQARSAFTTTGFTSRETESIVNHPLRRRIILNLMLLGNVGIVSFMSSLIITFIGSGDDIDLLSRLGILLGGVLVLYLFARSKVLDRLLSKLIERLLRRWTRVYTKDYDSLLFLSGEYEIIKLDVRPGSWLEGKSLAEAQLSDEGILVIGVRRQDGYYVGVPRGGTQIYLGDQLIIYGRDEGLRLIADRIVGPEGDAAHREAVAVQRVFEGKPGGTELSKQKPGLFKRLFQPKSKGPRA